MEDILKQHKQAWDLRYKLEAPFLAGQPISYVIDFYHAYREEFWNKPILDIGCGNGRHLGFLLDRHHIVYGIDLSREAISQLRSRVDNPLVKNRFLCADSTRLPFPNQQFYCVLSVKVFHHGNYNYAKKSFQEASRCLAHNGLFFLMVRSCTLAELRPTVRLRDRGLTFIRLNSVKREVVKHQFTRQEIYDLAKQAGFKVLHIHDFIHITFEGKKRSHWVAVMRKVN